MEDEKKWIESQDLLFYLPVLNRSFSKAVTNFWKLMVPNCLRLPLEDSKIDNKLSIRQVSFAIIRGNLLLAKKCICTINEKVPVLKIKLRCTNYTNTFECILFEQISDHYLHSPGITV